MRPESPNSLNEKIKMTLSIICRSLDFDDGLFAEKEMFES